MSLFTSRRGEREERIAQAYIAYTVVGLRAIDTILIDNKPSIIHKIFETNSGFHVK